VRDARLLGNMPKAKDWLAQDFLAIDRFTGGGVYGAKFDTAPLLKAQFKGEMILHDPEAWELGWLTLLLRDLYDGRLTIGFGAAKGYGRVKAADMVWHVGYLSTEDHADFPALFIPPAGQPGLYTVASHPAQTWLPEGWLGQAQQWVTDFNTQIHSFKRDNNWRGFDQDTFFGTYRDENGAFQSGSDRLLQQYGVARAEVTNHE
jgi:hypothetical protein